MNATGALRSLSIVLALAILSTLASCASSTKFSVTPAISLTPPPAVLTRDPGPLPPLGPEDGSSSAPESTRAPASS